jgi:hypothetical protein
MKNRRFRFAIGDILSCKVSAEAGQVQSPTTIAWYTVRDPRRDWPGHLHPTTQPGTPVDVALRCMLPAATRPQCASFEFELERRLR